MYQKIAPGVYRPVNPEDVKTMEEAMAIIAALCTPARQVEVLKAVKVLPKPPKHKKGCQPHHVHFKNVGESILRYSRVK